jgi:hypothetical protein
MHECKNVCVGYLLRTCNTAGLPHILRTWNFTLLQWTMQFMKYFAWGANVIAFCSLLIRPLLRYVVDVRPERNHTIFNHPPPFVASQSREVGTISRSCDAIASLQEGHKIRSQPLGGSGLTAHTRGARLYAYWFVCVNAFFFPEFFFSLCNLKNKHAT